MILLSGQNLDVGKLATGQLTTSRSLVRIQTINVLCHFYLGTFFSIDDGNVKRANKDNKNENFCLAVAKNCLFFNFLFIFPV